MKNTKFIYKLSSTPSPPEEETGFPDFNWGQELEDLKDALKGTDYEEKPSSEVKDDLEAMGYEVEINEIHISISGRTEGHIYQEGSDFSVSSFLINQEKDKIVGYETYPKENKIMLQLQSRNPEERAVKTIWISDDPNAFQIKEITP